MTTRITKNSKTASRLSSIALATFAAGILACPLMAQDDKPWVIGSFENTGSVTAGYRFTDISGYRPKYDELFGLNSGPRLLDFSLFGHVVKDKHTLADDYSIVTNGFGGEPWSTFQANVRKKDVYELRINFVQSHFYWNRNDSAALPSGRNGLTSNHDWATVRKIGSANLLLHATSNLRFTVEYSRNTRGGVQDTTRVMDYFGSPSTWGPFARANPYYLVGLIHEKTNRLVGGVDYTLRAFTLHYKIGVQSFEDSLDGSNPYAGQRSINVDDPVTAQELLTSATWADHRTLNTPVSEFSYVGKVTSKFKLHGDYLYYRYYGPATLAMAATGTARYITSSSFVPYSLTESSRADMREPSHTVDQGFTYDVNHWFGMQGDYRYSRFNVFADSTITSTNNGLTQSGLDSNEWRIGTSTFDYNLVFTPLPSLLIRAGVRYLKSDIEFLDAGVIDPKLTKRVKTAWPTLSLHYQPNKIVSLRADVDEINNGTSYTRIVPHTAIGSRFVARVRPMEKFWIENTFAIRNDRNFTTDFHYRLRSNDTTVTYEINERLSGFAGFSYSSFYSESVVNFLPGLSLISQVSLTDQNVQRLWHGGFNAVPVKHVTLSFAGNFVRVNGQGVILGSVPLYGPMTFPYASGSLAYDAGKPGKLTLQLQRTYYTEQIVPGNNFGANILLIAWTRSF
jgi:hypothetical protein